MSASLQRGMLLSFLRARACHSISLTLVAREAISG